MIETIDLDEPIPREWRVRGADSHLHSIGLSLFKPQLHPNRRLLYHPLLVFIITLFIFCKSFIILYCHVMNYIISDETHIYLGDMDLYYTKSCATNVMLINASVFTIGSQFVNYYNYRNGIKPTDL